MTTLTSQISTNEAEFKNNYTSHLAEISRIQELSKKNEEREATTVEKLKARGKYTARERIQKLIDLGSPFLELNKLAAFEVYEDNATAFR